MKIAIIGGGVIGLSTGLKLRDEFRDAEITIVASNYNDIVSYVAAGIFRVGSSYLGPNEHVTEQIIKNSYDYYNNICNSYEARNAGITNISGYIFSNSSPRVVRNRWMENLVPIYRAATPRELKLMGDWKYGSFFKTLIVQPTIYLPWVTKKLKDANVRLNKNFVTSFNQLQDYDFVMNCAGLGARELCNDNRMVAIRGQVIKVKAPWIKTFVYGETDSYIIPNVDGTITLGGCRHFDSERTNLCSYDAKAIRTRCENLIPSLKNATTLRHLTGLRPHREDGVRVAFEKISPKIKVIHNYGHGGYGVCTAPGTVKYAIDLLKDAHCLSSKL